jgi:RHH-type transcriptional regulator, proline utilization regulon repressor / proline dehydrogenase / delta 1-pyrroline-5-carboxylate dehydrogenase
MQLESNLNLVPSTKVVSLQHQIEELGNKVFNLMSQERPSFFKKSFWSGKMLHWSLNRPELKRDLFRLVDVLPSLANADEVIDHTEQYLGAEAEKLNHLFRWGLHSPKGSIRSRLVAYGIQRGVKEMANQFIAGDNAKASIKTLKNLRSKGFTFTVDLLGEYALSDKEAVHYLERYCDCIDEFVKLGKSITFNGSVYSGQSDYSIANNVAIDTIPDRHDSDIQPFSLSIKLSALYPHLNPLNLKESIKLLIPRISILLRKASKSGCSVYFDAEDSQRRDIILAIFKNIFQLEEFKDFPLPGIVIQAYSKDILAIATDLVHYAKKQNKRIAVRLVKGAYWDHEISQSIYNSWEFPLYTNKLDTDIAFEDTLKLLFDNIEVIYPAIASHNVRSISYGCCYAQSKSIMPTSFELQMLHGMAEPIAESYRKLGYLVRRLLENTSNESFLKHTFFDSREIKQLLSDPRSKLDH